MESTEVKTSEGSLFIKFHKFQKLTCTQEAQMLLKLDYIILTGLGEIQLESLALRLVKRHPGWKGWGTGTCGDPQPLSQAPSSPQDGSICLHPALPSLLLLLPNFPLKPQHLGLLPRSGQLDWPWAPDWEEVGEAGVRRIQQRA